jgi:K+-transporting ATPase ATPase C chain
MLSELLTSLRIAFVSIVACVIGYGAIVLGGAMLLAPQARLGSLVTVDGVVVGSSQIAQAFTRAEYLWPRPSAVDYAADATGGSNLSPASPVIRKRSEDLGSMLGATPERPAPAELVLASGSGVDPHITEAGALYQADRIAAARGVPTDEVRRVMTGSATPVGPGDPARLINVLLFNIELDRRFPVPGGGQ